MKDLVAMAFGLLMASVIALALYYALFGQDAVGWRGALYFAGEQVEGALSEYYYYYCYVPTAKRTEELDVALGGITQSPTHLSMKLYDTSENAVSFSDTALIPKTTGGYVQVKHWSTGWK